MEYMSKAKGKEKDADVEDKNDAKGEEKPEGGEGAAEGAEGAEGEGGGKKSKKKIIIIGVLALVVLLGGAGGAYFAGLFGKHEVKSEVELGPDGKPIEKPVFYTLPEFLVNLNSGTKQTSFLKTTVIIELVHAEDVSQVEANLPRLLDAFNTYLRELRASDLAGSAGIQRLREELLLRANKAIAPTKVNDILFKEIIVQ
jgi:flagellar FliL protein